MTPQRLSRTQRLLLLACVLFGLFVMHGVQATPSPVHAAGAMVGAGSHDHGTATGHRAVAASEDCPGGHCGESHAGAVCFALLVLAGLILLLTGVRAGPVLPDPARRRRPFVRRGPPRARPPTVYQLSVLRL